MLNNVLFLIAVTSAVPGAAQPLADPAPAAPPPALAERWAGYLDGIGGPGAEVTSELLEVRWRGYAEAISAYGERVEGCAAGSPQAGETDWAAELVARFGAEEVEEQRSAIAAWMVVAHLRAETHCHGDFAGRVAIAEARYRALLGDVVGRFRSFVASLEGDESAALAPQLAELEEYAAALDALPATALAMGDGGLRRAGWESKAAHLPVDMRGFLESQELFRKPVDFLSQTAALDRVLEASSAAPRAR